MKKRRNTQWVLLILALLIGFEQTQTFAQNSNLHDPRQAETRERCLDKWKVPDQLRTAPDRSERDSAMFHRLLGVL